MDYVSIGRYSYCGNVKMYRYNPSARLYVGNFCSIADGCDILLGGEHNYHHITTFPFYDKDLQAANPTMPKIDAPIPTTGDVIIEHDVWIGKDALILSGCHIRPGVIIGAGSVVRPCIYDVRSGERYDVIPAYAIVLGNPAVIVGFRYDAATTQDLLDIAWWNWSDDAISAALPLLCSDDIQSFISKYKQ